MLQRVLQKGSKNFIFAAALMVLTSGAAFFATPIIIHAIGKTDFGIYHLTIEFLFYLGMCEIGMSSAAYGMLNKAWISQDQSEVKKTVWALLKEYFKLYPIIFATLVLLTYLFLNLSVKDTREEVRYAFILMASTGVLIPLNVFRSFIHASERAHILSKVSSFQLLILTAMNITMALMGYGLLGLAVAYFIAQLFFNIVSAIFALRLMSRMEDKGGEANVDSKEVWRVSMHGFFQELLGRMSHSSDAIILSFFAPPATLTYFVTNQRTGQFMDGLLKNIGNATWASVTRVREDKRELQRIMNFFNLFFPFVANPMAFSLAYNNHDFINLWLGENFYVSDLFSWVVIYGIFTIACTLTFWGWLFVGFQKVPKTTFAMITAGILNVILSVIFTHQWGIIGPVVGTLVAYYGYFVWHLRILMRRELGIDVTNYIWNWLKVSLVLLALYFGLQQISLLAPDSWLGLLGNMAIIYLLALACCTVVLVRKSHIQQAKDLFANRN